mgnify:CR=1 FL=1
MSDLVFYKDAEFTTPFSIEDIGDVDAGDIKFVEGYLKNESDRDIIKIEPEVFDEDINVIDLPTQLESKGWQKVIIRYTPKTNRETGLSTFITFWGKKRIPPE